MACRVPACAAAINALTRLYAPSRSKPRLCFCIDETPAGIELRDNDRCLWRSRQAGEIIAAFELHLYRRVIAALAPRLLSVHAAAVGTPRGALLFAGASGAGKSSLCARALLDGYRYFSDEFALIDARGRIHPFPRPLQWDEHNHPALPDKLLRDAGFADAAYRFPAHDGAPVSSRLWLPPRIGRRASMPRAVVFATFDTKLAHPELKPVPFHAAVADLAELLHHELPSGVGEMLLKKRLAPGTVFFALRFADVHAGWQCLRAQLTRIFHNGMVRPAPLVLGIDVPEWE